MSYYERDGDGNRCDACGLECHHRPARTGDRANLAYNETISYEPKGSWVWAPWVNPTPCDVCGLPADRRVTDTEIADAVARVAAMVTS